MDIERDSEEEENLLYELQKDKGTSVVITTSQMYNKNNRKNWIPKRNRFLSFMYIVLDHCSFSLFRTNEISIL